MVSLDTGPLSMAMVSLDTGPLSMAMVSLDTGPPREEGSPLWNSFSGSVVTAIGNVRPS
jgi:hypothetical protein